MGLFGDIIKSFKTERKIAKSANKLKKTLFEEYKSLTLDVSLETGLQQKKHLLYLHDFLADAEIGVVLMHIIESEIKSLKEGLR